MTDEELNLLDRRYGLCKQTMPGYIAAAKRVHVGDSRDAQGDWYVGWGKDESCQIEGTQNHWRWLAMLILGLADPGDAPWTEDRETPEVVPALIAEVRRLRAERLGPGG